MALIRTHSIDVAHCRGVPLQDPRPAPARARCAPWRLAGGVRCTARPTPLPDRPVATCRGGLLQVSRDISFPFYPPAGLTKKFNDVASDPFFNPFSNPFSHPLPYALPYALPPRSPPWSSTSLGMTLQAPGPVYPGPVHTPFTPHLHPVHWCAPSSSACPDVDIILILVYTFVYPGFYLREGADGALELHVVGDDVACAWPGVEAAMAVRGGAWVSVGAHASPHKHGSTSNDWGSAVCGAQPPLLLRFNLKKN